MTNSSPSEKKLRRVRGMYFSKCYYASPPLKVAPKIILAHKDSYSMNTTKQFTSFKIGDNRSRYLLRKPGASQKKVEPVSRKHLPEASKTSSSQSYLPLVLAKKCCDVSGEHVCSSSSFCTPPTSTFSDVDSTLDHPSRRPPKQKNPTYACRDTTDRHSSSPQLASQPAPVISRSCRASLPYRQPLKTQSDL